MTTLAANTTVSLSLDSDDILTTVGEATFIMTPTYGSQGMGTLTGTQNLGPYKQAVTIALTSLANPMTYTQATGAVSSPINTFTGNVSVSANSSDAALTVTQTGAGNAFVVEDSASPDSTPFVIDGSGNVTQGATSYTLGSTVSPYHALIGTSAYGPQFVLQNKVVDTSAAYQVFRKDRNGAIVANGDTVGTVIWNAFDGTSFVGAASIEARIDGTPGTNDMPGRLVFSTTADGASSPTERMRIDSSGNVGIGGVAAAFAKMQINGTLPSSSAYSYGFESAGLAPSTSTAGYFLFSSSASTQAAAFTLTNLTHYNTYQGTIGATSAVTNQYGFNAVASLTGATNNYGFYSNIASAANRYNFYAAGTADNYFAGVVSTGSYLQASGTALVKVATAIPAGGAQAIGVSSTTTMGVYFGSGAPTVSAAKGSLYLRSDGTTTNNRMYVNTDGSTTWTAVTTAA